LTKRVYLKNKKQNQFQKRGGSPPIQKILHNTPLRPSLKLKKPLKKPSSPKTRGKKMKNWGEIKHTEKKKGKKFNLTP